MSTDHMAVRPQPLELGGLGAGVPHHPYLALGPASLEDEFFLGHPLSPRWDSSSDEETELTSDDGFDLLGGLGSAVRSPMPFCRPLLFFCNKNRGSPHPLYDSQMLVSSNSKHSGGPP